MLSYHRLKRNPCVLLAFTSLTPEAFDTLLIPFAQAWETYVSDHYRHKDARKRRYGGGRKPRLMAIEDKLLFMLFYFKVYPIQEIIAHLFGMSQGRANEWIHKLSPILENALGEAHCLPERDPVWSKNSCGLAMVVLQESTEPLSARDRQVRIELRLR